MAEHGGDVYSAGEMLKCDDIIDFSANINPFGVSETVRRAIISEIDSLSDYPDPYSRKLRKAIGTYHHIPIENIVCGNGGADLIFRIVRALSPKKAIIPVPSFSEYSEALKEISANIQYYQMDFPLRLTEDFLANLSGEYDFTVLCNPNNPTGELIDSSLLRKILSKACKEGISVLIDECFYDMSYENNSVINEFEKYPNVIILKSLTKLYAIAGLRIGYGICADSLLIEKIRTTGQCWAVNTLAEVAGCAAIADIQYREHFMQFLKTERDFLYSGLKSLGFEVWKPNANYIFFRSENIPDLDQKLLNYKILLRNCSNYTGLQNGFFRAAVKNHSDNKYLLNCLKEIINEKRNNICLQNP